MGCSVCGKPGHNRRSCKKTSSEKHQTVSTHKTEVNGVSSKVEPEHVQETAPETAPETESVATEPEENLETKSSVEDEDEEESESSDLKIPIGQGLDAIVSLPVWLTEEEKRNAMAAVGHAAYKMAEVGLQDPEEPVIRTAMAVLNYALKASIVLNHFTFRAEGDGQVWLGTGKTRKEALTSLINNMFPTRLARECFKRSVWRLT